jgi:hypothetical protein
MILPHDNMLSRLKIIFSCKQVLISALGLFFLISISTAAAAHQPVLESAEGPVKNTAIFPGYDIMPLKDPTFASLAMYGKISETDELDIYEITTSKTENIPVTVLVPVRPSNKDFNPSVVIISKDITSNENGSLPFSIPEDYRYYLISPDGSTAVFKEPFSQENYYLINEISFPVTSGASYYIVVFEPKHHQGSYTLGLGSAENFTDTSFFKVAGDVIKIKLGIYPDSIIPWIDIFGLFIFLAGFVIGLGAVTVIDMHGFLGRKSPYWTESTIRAHKVTKPLIWLGYSLALIGGSIFYRENGLSGVAAFHALAAVLLFFNGLFLSFWVSPRLLQRERDGRAQELLPASWQGKIAVSFVVSFTGWWGSLFLLVWQLLVNR